jgi:monovalent cation:H+ antiporter-2, CPA2 family
MSHDTALIATIAVSLALAFLFGFAAIKLRLPPLVGYLLAGVAVGPFTPGFVADAHLAPQLAEIGVILLMFGVGMHLSIRDLWEVRVIALPGALAQMAVATALGAALGISWGWPLRAGLVFGLTLSVASTVVLLRSLEERRRLTTSEGRIAIGWLIVEDLSMVFVLVLLPALAGAGAAHAGGPWVRVGWALGEIAVLLAFMLLIGSRILPWILKQAEGTGSRELFTVAVLAIALGVAFASAQMFGVSFALGAFVAGVVIHETDLSHRAALEALPLRDAFAVLFFVSVGMLFDPSILLRHPL